MTKNKWQLRPAINQEKSDNFPELNRIVLQLLDNRGLSTKEEIDAFLYPSYDEHILDPFLFHDMKGAVERLLLAIDRREKVMVYGDYDADGVCASAILSTTLQALGLKTDVYIPFRETEGYGLNKKSVQQIIHEKFDLVITVDCGVSNVEEIATLTQAGIEVIVLDHHQEPMKRPEVLALINPSLADSGYPFSGLCGAGVAFKFVQAIIKVQSESDSPIKLPAGFDKWLLDLVAIATVGDICPLIGENRIMVKYGLTVIERTRRLGLKRMLELVSQNRPTKIDTQLLGWRIVPRINAAGRIDHASMAFNLLTSVTESEVEKFVLKIEENNSYRQKITEKALGEALLQIGEPKEEEKILFVVGEDWPAGIVGLVAGRICDRFHRPTLAITKEGEKHVGSGRSIPEFDITAALKKCDKFLERFGGHSQACGFTVIGDGNFSNFKKCLSELAVKELTGVDLRPSLDIDAEVALRDINWQLWEELNRFEPFGEANPKPLLLASNLIINQVQTVGADGKHLRVIVSQGDNPDIHKLIGFSFGDWCARLKIGDKIDVVFELDVNEWNGNRELQLKIVDLRVSQ